MVKNFVYIILGLLLLLGLLMAGGFYNPSEQAIQGVRKVYLQGMDFSSTGGDGSCTQCSWY